MIPQFVVDLYNPVYVGFLIGLNIVTISLVSIILLREYLKYRRENVKKTLIRPTGFSRAEIIRRNEIIKNALGRKTILDVPSQKPLTPAEDEFFGKARPWFHPFKNKKQFVIRIK